MKKVNLKVKETVGVLVKSQQFERIELQRGLLSIGTMVKMSSKRTSVKKLNEYVS